MTNPNIQAPIPISGRGLVYRPNGEYGSGEYRRLTDVELNNEGQLISRRPIRPTVAYEMTDDIPGYDVNPVVDPLVNPRGFLGHWGSTAIVADRDGMYAVTDNYNIGKFKIWNLADMPKAATAQSTHFPVGFHYYNSRAHVVTWYYNAGGSPEIRVYTRTETEEPNIAISGNFAGYVSNIVINTATANWTPKRPITSFVHKDRLWIITPEFAYFSKPTDFTEFDSPDGGFFKFPGQKINWALALKDSIYIICDSAVFMVTYSTDPNVDAQVRQVSDGLGGDMAVAYEDNVYFIKEDKMYAVSSTSVVKVLDLDLNEEFLYDIPYGGYFSTKMVAFGEYIIFFKMVKNQALTDSHKSTFLEGIWFSPISVNGYLAPYVDAPSEDVYPSAYFINMSNGSVHSMNFRDGLDIAGGEQYRGFPVDMYSVPIESYNNEHNLFIATSRVNQYYTTSAGGITTHVATQSQGYTYIMKQQEPDFSNSKNLDGVAPLEAVDRVYNYTTKLWEKRQYDTEIEFSSFSPDSNEYYLKKLRTLMFMGKLPQDGCRVSYAFDNRAWGPAKPVSHGLGGANARPPFPIRLPINQRARSVSIRLDMAPTNETESQDISITDMRLLWTYSKRSTDKITVD